jgi:hypothetical protein
LLVAASLSALQQPHRVPLPARAAAALRLAAAA